MSPDAASHILCRHTQYSWAHGPTLTASVQVRGRPMSHMQTRIPSWLHMPSLGIPTVASWGENLGDMVDLSQVRYLVHIGMTLLLSEIGAIAS